MSPRAAWRLEALGFRNVYDYVAGKADWGAAGFPREGTAAEEESAAEAAVLDVPTCRLDDQLAAVRDRVRASGWSTCVVVNEERVVLGLLGRRALADDDTTAETTVEDAMTEGPSTTRPNTPARAVRERLERQGLTQALITTSDGRLVGVVRAE